MGKKGQDHRVCTVGDQISAWETVLPEELLRLPDELARVDDLLDDEAFVGTLEPFFDPRIGCAAPDDADQAHDQMRVDRGGRVVSDPVGQGR